MTTFQKKLWIGLGIMALISPLGLILPDKFKAADAWGEWSAESLKEMLGFVPRGLQRLSDFWSAPLPDYSFGAEHASPAVQFLAYIVSGLLGIGLVVGMVVLIRKFLLNRKDEH